MLITDAQKEEIMRHMARIVRKHEARLFRSALAERLAQLRQMNEDAAKQADVPDSE